MLGSVSVDIILKANTFQSLTDTLSHMIGKPQMIRMQEPGQGCRKDHPGELPHGGNRVDWFSLTGEQAINQPMVQTPASFSPGLLILSSSGSPSLFLQLILFHTLSLSSHFSLTPFTSHSPSPLTHPSTTTTRTPYTHPQCAPSTSSPSSFPSPPPPQPPKRANPTPTPTPTPTLLQTPPPQHPHLSTPTPTPGTPTTAATTRRRTCPTRRATARCTTAPTSSASAT